MPVRFPASILVPPPGVRALEMSRHFDRASRAGPRTAQAID
jgi:hypothetical protein